MPVNQYNPDSFREQYNQAHISDLPGTSGQPNTPEIEPGAPVPEIAPTKPDDISPPDPGQPEIPDRGPGTPESPAPQPAQPEIPGSTPPEIGSRV